MMDSSWSTTVLTPLKTTVPSMLTGVSTQLLTKDRVLTITLAAIAAILTPTVIWLREREHTRRANAPYQAQMTIAKAHGKALKQASRGVSGITARLPSAGSAEAARKDAVSALEKLKDTKIVLESVQPSECLERKPKQVRGRKNISPLKAVQPAVSLNGEPNTGEDKESPSASAAS